ncbi:hypothetical protein DdX_14990 [Ditylenchus destructor]|uniref:Uncharacterized protein n=1 Tax=Ditylenchus destructor TaxID=166010 RepID=A0AAD4MS85_9BILA|nr:hypothetical protein DdX_14990 [Ditylenchus destructor]
MEYLPYLNLSEAIAAFLCHVINFATMSKIVYHRFFEKHKYPRVKCLSPMLMIFMVVHIICSLMNMPYYSYVILKWSEAHDPNIVHGYRFWLGIPVANYFVVIPALVFFLTLESERMYSVLVYNDQVEVTSAICLQIEFLHCQPLTHFVLPATYTSHCL